MNYTILENFNIKKHVKGLINLQAAVDEVHKSIDKEHGI